MVRPEKGSLAERSDIKNRLRLLRNRGRIQQTANTNESSQTDNLQVEQVKAKALFLKNKQKMFLILIPKIRS